jgi:hypothetical protein
MDKTHTPGLNTLFLNRTIWIQNEFILILDKKRLKLENFEFFVDFLQILLLFYKGEKSQNPIQNNNSI